MDITRVERIMNSNPAQARAPHGQQAGFAQGRYSPIMEPDVPILDSGFIHADAAYDEENTDGFDHSFS